MGKGFRAIAPRWIRALLVRRAVSIATASLVLLASVAPRAPAAGASGAPPPIPTSRRDADGLFVNLDGDTSFPGPLVTFPFFLRRLGTMITGRDGHPERVANDGAFLRSNATHSMPTVTWIGHATLLVQMGHQTFLTDPIWSERASPLSFAGPKRAVPPGIALDDLPPIDFVLISHNHYDHLDVPTLVALAHRRPATRFLVPLGNALTLREAGIARVTELDWGQEMALGALRIVCLPSQHWSRRGLLDGRRALWASWAVIGPERRFYFAGDTGYFDGFTRIGAAYGPFDLAAVPIGAYLPRAMMRASHLDPAEAVQAGRDVRARALIGIHYGTFDLSDEPPDRPPKVFRAAGRAAGFGADAILTPRIGETKGF